jgi:arylsulfatase A-like enzyme
MVNSVSYIADITATCIDLAGAEYPEEYQGNSILPWKERVLVIYFREKNGREVSLFSGNMKVMEQLEKVNGNW